MSPIPHGGRIAEARRRFPHAPEPFIDLSTGINPTPYPFTPPPAEAWTRLPEPEQLQALQHAAAIAYGVPDPAMVVPAPGTQALIQLLPRFLPQPAIDIPGPTYAEHEAAWRQAGATIHPGAPALVLCNPNNPDGTRHDPAALAVHRYTLLVVDESFADLEPGLSLAPHLPLPRTVILRSFGKTYGLAGLRLGFALAEPALAERLRTAVGPWPVSGPAIAIATEALADRPWLADMMAHTHARSARLDELLQDNGGSPPVGTCLFRTAHWPAAAALARHLGEAGILVRSFHDSPTRLRFGLPPDPPAWNRLQEALRTRPALSPPG